MIKSIQKNLPTYLEPELQKKPTRQTDMCGDSHWHLSTQSEHLSLLLNAPPFAPVTSYLSRSPI